MYECVSDIESMYDTCFATDGHLLQIINRFQIENPDGAQSVKIAQRAGV